MERNARAQKYTEEYAQGVIIRDHSLETYTQFLHRAGETQRMEQLVQRVLRRKETCCVLDIGCGNANALRTLNELFGKRVHTVGVDLVPPAEKKGVDVFLEGDAHNLEWGEAFDLIFSFRVLHQMGELVHILTKIGKSLSPGGRAYVWIRMREPSGNGTFRFVGEMNEEEERGLLRFSLDENGIKVMVHAAKLQHNELPSSLAEGYTVLFYRPL